MVGSNFKMVVGPLFSSEGIAEPVMNRYKLLVASWIGVFFRPQKKHVFQEMRQSLKLTGVMD